MLPRPSEIEIKKHLSEDSLKELIRAEEDPRIRERLAFIRSLYEGDSVEKVADRVARENINISGSY